MTDQNIRRFGVVEHYREDDEYGFVRDLGVVNTDEAPIEGRVYFRKTFLRDYHLGNYHVAFPKGTIVEYQLSTREIDGKTSLRAYDLTGLLEGQLPLHHGIVTFTPYARAHAQRATQDQRNARRTRPQNTAQSSQTQEDE